MLPKVNPNNNIRRSNIIVRVRFEKAFGLRADTLVRMQSAHELAEARGREDQIAVKRVAA